MRAAVAFLTAVGGATPPSERALLWFPVVGVLLGGALGGVWWGAGEIWPPVVAAAVLVVADLAATGMLHLDGLADSADGLLPPLATPDRRLEVMADPSTGAFGVGAVAAALLLRVAALSALAPNALLVAGVWCASRTAMAVVATTVPYARNRGLASAFLGDNPAARRLPVIVIGAPLAGGLIAAGTVSPVAASAVALAAAALASLGVAALARRRIGGFTGDVLGAVCLTSETAALLALAARW